MKKLLILLFAALSAQAYAQDTKPQPDLKAEVVVNNKRFKVYNNWLSGGGGMGYNTQIPQPQFVGGIDFNFHLKYNYFQIGAVLAGDDFGNYNNSLLHAGYGKRIENEKFNISAFAGISYGRGYRKVAKDLYDLENPYTHPGVYLNAQLIKKITYDVGLGLGVMADVNKTRTLAGVMGVLYFSGAYKGKKR